MLFAINSPLLHPSSPLTGDTQKGGGGKGRWVKASRSPEPRYLSGHRGQVLGSSGSFPNYEEDRMSEAAGDKPAGVTAR